MNAAYRTDYQEYRKKYDVIFDAANCTERPSEPQRRQLSARREYLIYREDLYGYSVCDLKSLEIFQYLPSEAFPEDGEQWACSFSVMALDFTEPMKEHKLLDIRELFEEFFEKITMLNLWDGHLKGRWRLI